MLGSVKEKTIEHNYSLHAINVRQSKINRLKINTLQNIFKLNLHKWVKLYYICTIQLRK